MARSEQPGSIRLTHWIMVPSLVLMAASGLQIYTAYPFLGPRGALYRWFPFQGATPPEWLRFGNWLAGARHVHFALAWLLIGNALLYLAYVVLSGEWRRRIFMPARDARNAVLTALGYLRIRPMPQQPGLYNGLQRAAYTSAIFLGAVEILSGLAIWKPVQWWWLTACFGGYDAARVVHLFGLVALSVFAIGHVTMVAAHPRTFLAMVTGGKRG